MSQKYFTESYVHVKSVMDGEVPESGLGWVSEFEARFSDHLEVEYAVAMNSGTSALHAGLHALGVGPGDEVISPALTVIMDSYATLAQGAKPVFADVSEESWLIDPLDVERKITRRTKAIIVVSWFGAPVNMEPFREISRRYRIPILDDSAETLLARDAEGYFAGTAADVGVFSFEEKKHLTTGGEGGMLVTNSIERAQAARRFAGIGYKHLSAGQGRTSLDAAVFQNPTYERFASFGLNYRMTPVAAALGLGQLDHVQELISMRQRNAALFLEVLSDFPWMVPQRQVAGSDHAYYTLGVCYEGEREIGVPWSEVYRRFRENGGDGFYANCLCPFQEPIFASNPDFSALVEQGAESCSVAVALQPKIMAFKTHYRSEKDAQVQAGILAATLGSLS